MSLFFPEYYLLYEGSNYIQLPRETIVISWRYDNLSKTLQNLSHRDTSHFKKSNSDFFNAPHTNNIPIHVRCLWYTRLVIQYHISKVSMSWYVMSWWRVYCMKFQLWKRLNYHHRSSYLLFVHHTDSIPTHISINLRIWLSQVSSSHKSLTDVHMWKFIIFFLFHFSVSLHSYSGDIINTHSFHP